MSEYCPECPAVTAVVALAAAEINIRATAGVSGAWAGSLPSGSKVMIYETKEAGGMTWGRIDRGWVCMTYVRMDDAVESGPTEPPTETTPSDSAAEKVVGTVADTDALRVRSGPGTNNAMVSLLSRAPKKEHIDQVFSCYDKKVVVSVTDAIGEPVSKEETK